ncbi:MAG: hypothetical protein KKA62_05895 [Nanoarchaeota archaeon]|nr:hypothetical protein [Nanoarchaeota archaeon]MBU1643864.1 hypothetical protein [Nanoarchaeota archaeon]MBU1977456.1 hypothetical protein [Nanoarchaeota archaeon]
MKMAIDDVVKMNEAYRLIVGALPLTEGSEKILTGPEDLRFTLSNVDDIYLTIMKAQRGIKKEKDNGIRYLHKGFGSVHEAYVSGNFDQFKEAVFYLMKLVEFSVYDSCFITE